MKSSTKTSRKKIVSRVQAHVYGVAIGHNRNLISNNYGPKVKKYGPHRKAIADVVKTMRHKKRHLSGISPTSKSVRGSESLR